MAEHVDQAGHYYHLFQNYRLDQLKYNFEGADIPAIEHKLKKGIRVYSFFHEEANARYPL